MCIKKKQNSQEGCTIYDRAGKIRRSVFGLVGWFLLNGIDKFHTFFPVIGSVWNDPFSF